MPIDEAAYRVSIVLKDDRQIGSQFARRHAKRCRQSGDVINSNLPGSRLNHGKMRARYTRRLANFLTRFARVRY